MVRPHRVLASLVLAAQTLACRNPEPTPEAAPTDTPTPSTPQRGLPLPLLDMLELVGDNPDYLILRDAQALLDAGVPWQAFVLAQAQGAEQAGFFVQLQKWVEGPDPPLARAGIDLRG